MVSRRYLRIKVMQEIFAFKANERERLEQAEKKLDRAIQECYTLFCYFFSLFPELKRYRLNKLEDLKTKFKPTYDDLHPNRKFVDNLVIDQIDNNATLNRLWNNLRINWDDQGDFIAQIFQEIAKEELYTQYLNDKNSSYTQDQEFLLSVIENCFANSELLHWYFQEKNLHWFDDYNEALLMFYKNIKQFKENKGNENRIFPLFKNATEDKQFYRDLFQNTLLNDDQYDNIIESKLQNWELERLNGIDIILMKMAITEFQHFYDIPVKVTINEYIELAKWYSSNKSGAFINGLLDQIILTLKEEGKITKMGKGLLNN